MRWRTCSTNSPLLQAWNADFCFYGVWTDATPALLSDFCMQAAIIAYGAKDEELWLRYAAWMQRRNRRTGQLIWRASKALKDRDEFFAQYQARQQKLAGAGSAPDRPSCLGPEA